MFEIMKIPVLKMRATVLIIDYPRWKKSPSHCFIVKLVTLSMIYEFDSYQQMPNWIKSQSKVIVVWKLLARWIRKQKLSFFITVRKVLVIFLKIFVLAHISHLISLTNNNQTNVNLPTLLQQADCSPIQLHS